MNELFFKDKHVFGLDIGYNNLKVMEIDTGRKSHTVVGYGSTTFRDGAVDSGVLTKPEIIAEATHKLFNEGIIGNITTKRVALAIPASRSFNRNVQLPNLTKKDLDEAIRLETEQYIPMPIDELYVDYSIVRESDVEKEALVVAIPKKIVDSYMQLARLLGLEVVAIETTISAGGRLFVQAERSDVPTVLIDFGSISSDITIYDKGLVVTGTVPGGGDSFTNIIKEELGVTDQEAHVIKTKYGLGLSKKQTEIAKGLKPLLDSIIKEVKRVIRYYEERSSTDGKIGQIITMGGGANMPGLSEFMTNELRVPVRMCDPWQKLKFDGLQPPSTVEKSMYVTVAGLALMPPQEIFS